MGWLGPCCHFCLLCAWYTFALYQSTKMCICRLRMEHTETNSKRGSSPAVLFRIVRNGFVFNWVGAEEGLVVCGFEEIRDTTYPSQNGCFVALRFRDVDIVIWSLSSVSYRRVVPTPLILLVPSLPPGLRQSVRLGSCTSPSNARVGKERLNPRRLAPGKVVFQVVSLETFRGNHTSGERYTVGPGSRCHNFNGIVIARLQGKVKKLGCNIFSW